MDRVTAAGPADYEAWLALAGEVEPLFGPMVAKESFCSGLQAAIESRQAFCIKDDGGDLSGGVIIDPLANEIAWLAVSRHKRKQGIGRLLLNCALSKLDPARPVTVVTFDRSVQEGLPARTLYLRRGFEDRESAGLNPAGYPVVWMTLSGPEAGKPT